MKSKIIGQFFNCRCRSAASIDSSCFRLEGAVGVGDGVDCGCKVSRSLVEGGGVDGCVGCRDDSRLIAEGSDAGCRVSGSFAEGGGDGSVGG